MQINAGDPHQWNYLRNLFPKKKTKTRPIVHCESKGVNKAEEHIEDFVRKSWNKNFNRGCWMWLIVKRLVGGFSPVRDFDD
jgi:hypothetical protein